MLKIESDAAHNSIQVDADFSDYTKGDFIASCTVELLSTCLVDSIAIFGISSIPIFRIGKDMVFPPFVKRYFLNVSEFSGLLATG